jgi:fructosamine-3-kinase
VKCAASVRVALGADVRDARPIGGGSINEAYAVTLSDGRRVFVKTSARAPSDMYAREADGLAWLAEPGSLRVPRLIACEPGFLALELIEEGKRSRAHDEALGRGLARLHRSGAPSFGGPLPNYVGSLPQDNTPEPDWATFYRRRRLEPLVKRAVDRGALGAKRFDRLFAALDSLIGPDEPPSRLHGDLWGGNTFADGRGMPVVIDPAVYGGHREIDLAMMQLFGGFTERVFDAYQDEWPLADGWRDRVPLYQLYPLLVHVCLFGASYTSSVERAIDRLV